MFTLNLIVVELISSLDIVLRDILVYVFNNICV